MVPGFIGIGIAQINLLVDTIFANAKVMPEGSLVSLYVADRVTELVLGGYAIAVATAILPMMSHQASAGDYEGMKKTFVFSLRIVSFITIPAAVGLVILREPIVQVLFQHGLFVAESTRLTARALLYYSMGLPAFAAVKLIVPAFYSTQDTRTPVRVAVIHAACEYPAELDFSFLFFREVEEWRPGAGQRAGGLFQCFDFICYFPAAVWAAGDAGDPAVDGKDRVLRRRHGSRLLGRAAIFAVRYRSNIFFRAWSCLWH